MQKPSDTQLPFFAYGLFKPGQLAFFQIGEFVSKANEPSLLKGALYLRDGLPIINPTRRGSIKGVLLNFYPDKAEEAYERICAMEPTDQYSWEMKLAEGQPVNVLIGRHPNKGSKPLEGPEWNGWDDPLFKEALEVVEETLNSDTEDGFLKRIFRLQMAYLLLWSSIERYASLRYFLGRSDHNGVSVTTKNKKFAEEPAFASSLRQHYRPIDGLDPPRKVFKADDPKNSAELDLDSPSKAIEYYYQVRSNITHRGKGASWDLEVVEGSLRELLPIFRDVLKEAEREAKYPLRSWD